MISSPIETFVTEANKEYEICSLNLPLGTWLVVGTTLAKGDIYIGYCDYTGITRNNSDDESCTVIGLSRWGNTTITLELRTGAATSTVQADQLYCCLKAIRIG